MGVGPDQDPSVLPSQQSLQDARGVLICAPANPNHVPDWQLDRDLIVLSNFQDTRFVRQEVVEANLRAVGLP
jgi:hypothetical protein